jgi:serine/threonine-protein kinase
MGAQETLLNGRYRLVAQQGSGGMAVIYKATDLALGRTVAVKILRPSLTNDPEFLKRFRQEARNVANLSHPNIVTVHDVGQHGNTHYIVMEYIDGEDLKRLIRASAPFTIDRALSIAIKICAGVGYAHRAGLVHADVKPQNVLVTESDQVKVTDFGIAQALTATKPREEERQRVVWGSPHYFSPEQAQGEPPSPASDVYAIGIVLFEMLTGRLPFVGTDQQELAMAHIRETPPNASDLNPNVPVHLDRILQKVMSKEPASRYRTADQLGRILISYRRQGQVTTDQVPEVSNGETPIETPEPYQPATAVYAPPPYAQDRAPGLAVPAVPDPRAEAATNVYSQAPYNPSPATLPGTPAVASQYHQPLRPPDSMIQSRYRAAEPPPQLDLVTLVLAFLAFIAVMLLIPLWIAVYQAWAG